MLGALEEVLRHDGLLPAPASDRPLAAAGGLLLVDNVLQRGQVHRPEATGQALAIREFNAHVRADPRVESLVLPVADGLPLAHKRSTPG